MSPRLTKRSSGRMTALCSPWEQMTSSPLWSIPVMAIFSDSVQLRVKITRSGLDTPSREAAASRHFSTVRPACSAS